MKKIISISILLLTLMPTLAATSVFAQGSGGSALTASDLTNTSTQLPSTYTLLEPLPCVAGTNQNCTNGQLNQVDVQSYILYLFKIGIAIAVFLAIVMITWGGFIYMTSEAIPAKMDARGTITNAVLGLVGALGSYLLVVTIDPRLVDVSLVAVPSLHLAVVDQHLSASQMTIALGQQAKQVRAQAAGLRTQAADLQHQADLINAQIDSSENPVTEQERQDLQAQAQKLTDQAAQLKQQATGVEAIGTANQEYANMINNINGTYTDPAAVAAATQKIDANYNAAIAAAHASGDVVAQTNLQNQKAFTDVSAQNYSAQTSLINGVKTNTITNEADFEKAKEAQIRIIENQTTAATANVTDQTLLHQYGTDMSNRITEISALRFGTVQDQVNPTPTYDTYGG